MPSFGTIFSPFWKSNVQGAFVGLNFNVEKTHLLRALLDSIAYRLYDNIKN
jgi:glycerol kinase